jgi:hypothetical protein
LVKVAETKKEIGILVLLLVEHPTRGQRAREGRKKRTSQSWLVVEVKTHGRDTDMTGVNSAAAYKIGA